jgi:hypothetical protein
MMSRLGGEEILDAVSRPVEAIERPDPLGQPGRSCAVGGIREWTAAWLVDIGLSGESDVFERELDRESASVGSGYRHGGAMLEGEGP